MIPIHFLALALAAAAPGALPVADFEAGLCGWRTNDGGYASKATPAVTQAPWPSQASMVESMPSLAQG